MANDVEVEASFRWPTHPHWLTCGSQHRGNHAHDNMRQSAGWTSFEG